MSSMYPRASEVPCIRDGHNRPIDYLRVSVTDRCNLRCAYCMPVDALTCVAHSDLLTYEELAEVIRAAAGLGISKVRLTGGEPLVRAGFLDLVGLIARIDGIDDLAITTNGVLLEQNASALASAGLRRVNVSLDTLRRDRFAAITGVDALPQVLRGIEAAHSAGLLPIKINFVAMRGINEDEIVSVAAQTLNRDWHVRFIELMPLNNRADWADRYLPISEVKQKLGELGELRPHPQRIGASSNVELESPARDRGPARYYRLSGAIGTIGFISAISEHFCHSCNRLRLTADGRLRPCLLSDTEVDLRAVLRGGGGVSLVRQAILDSAALKPGGHGLLDPRQEMAPSDSHQLSRTMSRIGG